MVAATEQPRDELCTRLLHRQLPDRAARAPTARQAPARARARARRLGAADADPATSRLPGRRRRRRRLRPPAPAPATARSRGRDRSAVTRDGRRHLRRRRRRHRGGRPRRRADEGRRSARRHAPEVVGGLGGFAGLFDASAADATAGRCSPPRTDGVGTKVAIAQALDIHDTIGLDLVGMVVDDIVVCGAEPLFMTDYIACGRVVPERIAAIVARHRRGVRARRLRARRRRDRRAPGPAGAGRVRRRRRRDRRGRGRRAARARTASRAGDVVVAMASSGLHSNGYSLVRHVLLDRRRLGARPDVAELGRTLGEELLEPTRDLRRGLPGARRRRRRRGARVRHVTGGGLAANLARVLPRALVAASTAPAGRRRRSSAWSPSWAACRGTTWRPP